MKSRWANTSTVDRNTRFVHHGYDSIFQWPSAQVIYRGTPANIVITLFGGGFRNTSRVSLLRISVFIHTSRTHFMGHLRRFIKIFYASPAIPYGQDEWNCRTAYYYWVFARPFGLRYGLRYLDANAERKKTG